MKKLLAGLIVGFMIGATGTALAANDVVQAKFSKYFLKINDRESIEIEPLVHDGTTYLPVRQTAQLLGYEVGYDGETRTIKLNSATTKNGAKKDEGDDENMQTVQREKLSDVDRNVWVLITELRDRFGILDIPQATGETIIRKGDKEFVITETVTERPSYGEYTRQYGEYSIRVKYVAKHMFLNIEDLRAAGFIEN